MLLLTGDEFDMVDQSGNHPDFIFIKHRLFLWKYLKSFIYENLFDSLEDLVARLSIVASKVREAPGISGTIREILLQGYQACIMTGGRNFLHLS